MGQVFGRIQGPEVLGSAPPSGSWAPVGVVGRLPVHPAGGRAGRGFSRVVEEIFRSVVPHGQPLRKEATVGVGLGDISGGIGVRSGRYPPHTFREGWGRAIGRPRPVGGGGGPRRHGPRSAVTTVSGLTVGTLARGHPPQGRPSRGWVHIVRAVGAPRGSQPTGGRLSDDKARTVLAVGAPRVSHPARGRLSDGLTRTVLAGRWRGGRPSAHGIISGELRLPPSERWGGGASAPDGRSGIEDPFFIVCLDEARFGEGRQPQG